MNDEPLTPFEEEQRAACLPLPQFVNLGNAQVLLDMEAYDEGGELKPLTFGPFKPISMDVQFMDVDPEVLGLLTGGVMGKMPEPEFSIDINYPVKRTFWQWLRRKPKRWNRVYIPRARMETEK